jgi:hypothetical protein
MTHRLTGMPHQPQHTPFGDAVAMAKLGGSYPRGVLGDQAIDRFSMQPLADPTFPTVTTPSRSSWRFICHVYEQGRVQFESPQADHAYFDRPDDECLNL